MSKTKDIVNKAFKISIDYMESNSSTNTYNKWKKMINNIIEKLIHMKLVSSKTIKNIDEERNMINSIHSLSVLYKLMVDEKYDEFDKIFELLDDDESRKSWERYIMAQLLVHFVGYKNTEKILGLQEKKDCPHLSFYKKLPYYSPTTFYHTFCKKQYHPDFLIIDEDSYIFDVGAYIGDTAIYYAQFIKNGKIYAFEPTSQNFYKLQRNIEFLHLEDKITAIQKGIGDKPSETYIQFKNSSSRVGSYGEKIVITTIDQFIQENNISFNHGIIKVDVEGYEFNVLKGSINTIQKFHPIVATAIYHFDNDPFQIISFLKKNDYKIYLRGYDVIYEYVVFAV